MNLPPAEKRSPRKNERLDEAQGRRAFEAGVSAYDDGDWKSARRLLGDAVEADPRKQNRLRAAALMAALSPDRFALGLAAVLGAALVGVFLLARS